MRTFGKLSVIGVIAFAALQLLRPGIPIEPAIAEIQAPLEVRQVLQKDCYSCHSGERRLSWFDQIAPAYWLVRRDILTARRHLDFSTLGSKPIAQQRAVLYEAVNMIQLGAMPLPSFQKLHPEARVTSGELAALKAYLNPWPAAPVPPEVLLGNTSPRTGAAPAANPPRVSLSAVSSELNGLPFEAAFETWKPISFTDRGDNDTFRFILGNDVAIKAAQSGNISPWPDGARFAKIAWHRESGPDGLVHPGAFIQVEFMVKDAQNYRDTDRWGWGRWRGSNLKPYGDGPNFVGECTSCHAPVRGNDFVYTLPITAAKVAGQEVLNSNAALPSSLPYQPLGWSPITMYVDPQSNAMAVLLGNDAAMEAVQSIRNAAPTAPPAPTYRSGSVLALVTWSRRDDPHWFGARIPANPQSIEFVEVSTSIATARYREFRGPVLSENHADPSLASRRTNFILTLNPAQLP